MAASNPTPRDTPRRQTGQTGFGAGGGKPMTEVLRAGVHAMTGVLCVLALAGCFDDDKDLPTTPDEVASRIRNDEGDQYWLWQTLRRHPEFVGAKADHRKLVWIAISANRRESVEYFLAAGAEMDPPVAAYTGD